MKREIEEKKKSEAKTRNLKEINDDMP